MDFSRIGFDNLVLRVTIAKRCAGDEVVGFYLQKYAGTPLIKNNTSGELFLTNALVENARNQLERVFSKYYKVLKKLQSTTQPGVQYNRDFNERNEISREERPR